MGYRMNFFNSTMSWKRQLLINGLNILTEIWVSYDNICNSGPKKLLRWNNEWIGSTENGTCEHSGKYRRDIDRNAKTERIIIYIETKNIY